MRRLLLGSTFKQAYSFEERLKESKRIRSKYPDRVPVVCERNSNKLNDLGKKRYITSADTSFAQYVSILRKHIALKESEAIYVFVNEKVLPTSIETMGSLYAKYAQQDGFLYLKYDIENTFGN